MSRHSREDSNYETLADYARLIGVDRTTILYWVRKGKIKSQKDKHAPANKRHRLSKTLFTVNVEKFKKPYPKYSTTWSDAEIYTLNNWTGTDEQLAKRLGRSVNAVRIKRYRERNAQ